MRRFVFIALAVIASATTYGATVAVVPVCTKSSLDSDCSFTLSIVRAVTKKVQENGAETIPESVIMEELGLHWHGKSVELVQGMVATNDINWLILVGPFPDAAIGVTTMYYALCNAELLCMVSFHGMAEDSVNLAPKEIWIDYVVESFEEFSYCHVPGGPRKSTEDFKCRGEPWALGIVDHLPPGN